MSETTIFWIDKVIAALIGICSAVIAVYLSFFKERRRQQEEEKTRFAHMVQGVLGESANNHAALNSIAKWIKPGKAHAGGLFTDAIRAALNDPLFHRWSDHSLVCAVQVVKMQLEMINNILSMHREAATAGRGMTEPEVKALLIRAETVQEVILVMQELLQQTLQKFGVPILADSRTTEIDERLANILRRGADRLD